MGTAAARAEAFDVIAGAVNKAAANPNVPGITPENAKAVTAAIGAGVVPVLINAANKEPWYQSRVYWGLILAAFFTIAKPMIGELSVDEAKTADIANALATAGQGVGIALSWYGRYRAAKLKPLGS